MGGEKMDDTISRQELYEKVAELEELARNRVLDTPTAIGSQVNPSYIRYSAQLSERTMFKHMVTDFPSAQPERKWIPCSNPPKHHRDVLVRGNEAIGNSTVYKVMQWDVDTWRPVDYAPSIIWQEWSEI
jgi:hypothetical protein